MKISKLEKILREYHPDSEVTHHFEQYIQIVSPDHYSNHLIDLMTGKRIPESSDVHRYVGSS